MIKHKHSKLFNLFGKKIKYNKLILVIGFIAGALTTGSLIPQVIHTYQKWNNSQNTPNSSCEHDNGLSLERYIIYLVGLIFWFSYGVLLLMYVGWMTAFPILFFNVIAVIIAVMMIIAIAS